MYQNACYHKPSNTVYVWDDEKGLIKVPYKKYAYKKSPSGRYKTLDNISVEKVTSWSQEDEDKGLIYESDLNPVLRTLVDMYTDSDIPSTNHVEFYFDIEVDIEGGIAPATDPWQPITSIGFHNTASNERAVLLLDKEGTISDSEENGCKLKVFQTERELLEYFIAWYAEMKPTILSGWNIDRFDIPYTYLRIERVLGKSAADMLSPIDYVTHDPRSGRIKIHGVSCLDYLALYKIFNQNDEPSYSLEAISQKELGRGKVKYEGDLKKLYKTDLKKFVEYNITDVDLVVDLDKKLRFIELAKGICHKGHVTYEEVYMSSRYIDGAVITFMKRLDIVCPNKSKVVHEQDEDDDSDESESFKGAFVMIPKPGLYEWVYDEDMKALYPSIIQMLNISPETQAGYIESWDQIKESFYNKTPATRNAYLVLHGKSNASVPIDELRDYLKENDYAISAAGVLYHKSKKGLIPAILETWMAERDEFRALVKKYNQEGNPQLAMFYDGRQQVTKRINNAVYGVLGLPTFRFYNLHNAESITLTGQMVIKDGVIKKANEFYEKYFGITGQNVFYVDTDSAFLSASKIISKLEEKLGRSLSYDEKVKVTFDTSTRVEKYINEYWPEFCSDRMNSDRVTLEIKQEYVSETGFWITKKRYAQKIISEKGVSIKEITKGASDWKLDVKGLEVVRSDFPKLYREFMKKLLIDILNKVPQEAVNESVIKLKEESDTVDMVLISNPTGVKDLEKWQPKSVKKTDAFGAIVKGAPVHVKSALNYNSLMNHYKLNGERIQSSDKIKWVYLRKNPFNLDTIAFRGYDDPKEIVDFINTYIDREKQYVQNMEKKLDMYYEYLGWGSAPKNSNVFEFFSFS